MALNREQLRQKSKAAFRTKDVVIPQFDGDSIRLRQMTGGELVEWQVLCAKHEKAGTEGELAPLLVQKLAIDDAGEPLMELEDVLALPADVLTLLAGEAAELNGVSEKAVEAAAGN